MSNRGGHWWNSFLSMKDQLPSRVVVLLPLLKPSKYKRKSLPFVARFFIKKGEKVILQSFIGKWSIVVRQWLFMDDKISWIHRVNMYNLQFLMGWIDIFNPQNFFNLHNLSCLNHGLKRDWAYGSLFFRLFFFTQYTQYFGSFCWWLCNIGGFYIFFGTILLIIFILYRLYCYFDYNFILYCRHA